MPEYLTTRRLSFLIEEEVNKGEYSDQKLDGVRLLSQQVSLVYAPGCGVSEPQKEVRLIPRVPNEEIPVILSDAVLPHLCDLGLFRLRLVLERKSPRLLKLICANEGRLFPVLLARGLRGDGPSDAGGAF